MPAELTPLEVQRQEKAVRDWIATRKGDEKISEQQRYDRIKKLPRAEYLHELKNFLKATTEHVAKASDIDIAYTMLQAPQNWSPHNIQSAAKKIIDHEKARNNMVSLVLRTLRGLL